MDNYRFADAVGAEESDDSYGVDSKETSGFDVCEGGGEAEVEVQEEEVDEGARND